MSIIKNAAKGRRKAMQAIAENYQEQVFHVTTNLLLDADLAGAATAAAFKDLWQGMKNKALAKEETPLQFVMIKAAEQCKSRLMKANPKAFRLPSGKDFTLSAATTVSNQRSNELGYLLSNLPPIQRFVFVLHTIGQLNALQIGRVLDMDSATVEKVLAVEEENIRHLQSLSKKGFGSSMEQIIEMMAKEELTLPQKAQEQIAAGIDHIATPLEQRARKQRGTAAISAIVACLITAVVVAGVLLLPKLLSKADKTTNSQHTAGNGSTGSTSPSASDNTYTPPALDENLTYYANIDIKNYGRITVKLDQKNAPITCANFVKLAKEGFYDGLTFHRIIEGFMMQGGDPEGNGYGGSDNKIVGEFTSNGINNPLKHTRGAISMARSNAKNSASCQFFIVHEDTPRLDGDYAVFGYVQKGMDIVDKVCEDAEPTDGNGSIPASRQPIITSIKITTA